MKLSKKCLFAHGFEGLPTGSKNPYLSNLGLQVIAPTLFEKGWTLSAQRDQVLQALPGARPISALVPGGVRLRADLPPGARRWSKRTSF